MCRWDHKVQDYPLYPRGHIPVQIWKKMNRVSGRVPKILKTCKSLEDIPPTVGPVNSEKYVLGGTKCLENIENILSKISAIFY